MPIVKDPQNIWLFAPIVSILIIIIGIEALSQSLLSADSPMNSIPMVDAEKSNILRLGKEPLRAQQDSVRWNSTDLNIGLRIQYPSKWLLNHSAANTTEIYPDILDNSTKLTIGSNTLSSLKLEESVSEEVHWLTSNKTEFKLLDLKRSNVSNVTGYWLFYSYELNSNDSQKEIGDNRNNRTELEVLFSGDSGDEITEYDVTYSSTNSSFYKYLPEVADLINRIKITAKFNSDSFLLPSLRVSHIVRGMDYDTVQNKLYVTASGSNKLLAINFNNGKTQNISVGARPYDVALVPVDDVVFVANLGNNSVSIVDGSSMTETLQIPVGESPIKIVSDPDETDRLVFTANRDDNSVSVINGGESKLIETIPVGKMPLDIDVNPLMNRVYVANSEDRNISIISYYIPTNDSTGFLYSNRNVTIDSPPKAIAVEPNSNSIFVVVDNGLRILNGSTYKVTGQFDCPGCLTNHIALYPEGHTAFLTSRRLQGVYAYDYLLNKTDEIKIGHIPADVTINLRDSVLFVSGGRNDSIITINASSQKIMAGLYVNTPMTEGNVHCTNNDIRNALVFYDVETTVECAAVPNNGYKFSHWSGSLATGTRNDPTIILNLTKSGALTANYESSYDPLVKFVAEQYNIIYFIVTGLILSPIAGYLISQILTRVEKKRQLKYLSAYLRLIDNTFEQNREDKEICLDRLYDKREDILVLLKEGVISDSTYHLLKDRTAELMNRL